MRTHSEPLQQAYLRTDSIAKNGLERQGTVQTKPGDSMALGMPYDERIIKGSSQLLGRDFQPVLLSNEMNWVRLYRVLIGHVADAWVP